MPAPAAPPTTAPTRMWRLRPVNFLARVVTLRAQLEKAGYEVQIVEGLRQDQPDK
jgi:hypothetical protein